MSRRRFHVAYVCGDRGVPIGGDKGASAHVAELTRAMQQRGAEVRIIAARTGRNVAPSELPAPTVDLGAQRSVRSARQALFSGAASKSANARASEAFAVMLNQPLAKALERLDRDWSIDAIYERYSLWSHAAADYARAAGLPYALEVNAPLVEEQRRFRHLENRALAESLRGYVFESADRIYVPARALVDHVTISGGRRSSVYVVPNAADPARFRRAAPSRRRKAKADRDFVVGFLGSLKPWHGLDNLARAFRHLARRSDAYRLLIVGEGPLRRELAASFARMGCSRAVTFAGAVGRDEVGVHLERMDVAVAPYPPDSDFYFSPLKIFEYMAAGVPIVASDIGQIGEVLTNRKTALLHRPGAIREMVDCIERLRRSPALADRLAREAGALLSRRYTWKRNADRVLSMLATDRRRAKSRRA